MINPVNNTPYPDYRVPQNKVNSSENSSEHFSLNTSGEDSTTENGVIYEPSRSTVKEKESNGRGSSAERDSFSSVLDQAKQEESVSKNADIDYVALFDKAVSYIKNLLSNVRIFFNNLWESKPIMDGMDTDSSKSDDTHLRESQMDVSNVEASTVADSISNSSLPEDEFDKRIDSIAVEAGADKAILEALAKGDKDRFRNILSEGGRKVPARSTTLLTTYDASGKIVNLDPSDENKILHGDRRTQKL